MRRVLRLLCGDVPPGLAGLVVVAVLTMAVSTRQYASVWHSERTLWAHAVRLAPEKPRPLNNYCIALALEGRLAEARMWCEQAHRAGHSPSLPPWDNVEGERTARSNLESIDALLAAEAR